VSAPERYEQILAYLGSQLPLPVEQLETAGDLQFTAGEPAEVVVRLTDSSIIVSEYAGTWETPFKFSARPRRHGVLKWRRMPENALWSALSALLKSARDARLAQFEVCRYCERRTPPEWLHDAGICVRCANTHSGAVH
jgi:hypothetical protein